jgi:hypothetical protein
MVVMSCKRDQENGCIKWFRETLKQSSIPYRIFLGNGCSAAQTDEVVLAADDSYQKLAWKVQAAFKWVMDRTEHSTHILKTDSDCHIWPDRLLASNFEKYDYIGNFFDGHVNPASHPNNYASGAGYCLSRPAVERVVAADVLQTIEPITMWTYDRVYAEDMFVGKVLSPDIARRFHSEQYAPNFQGRNYNGPTDNLIVLGNVFDNKRTPILCDWISLDGLNGEKLKWAQDANIRMRAGDSAGALLLQKRIYD